MPDVNNPHDSLFRTVFSRKEAVVEYIENFLPEELVKKLDISTLEKISGDYIDEELRSFSSDIVYQCRLKSGELIHVNLLFEHKSFNSRRSPHLQLLRYVVRIWTEEEDNGEELIPILPIIIYHGKTKWEHRDFLSSFRSMDPILYPFFPNFNYLFTNLQNYSDDEILQMRLGLLGETFLMFKHYGDKAYLLQLIEWIFQTKDSVSKKEQEQNIIQIFWVYLLKTQKISEKELMEQVQSLPPQIKETAMSTYDVIMAKRLEEGLEKKTEATVRKMLLSEKFKTGVLAINDIADFAEVSIGYVLDIQKILDEEAKSDSEKKN